MRGAAITPFTQNRFTLGNGRVAEGKRERTREGGGAGLCARPEQDR